MPDKKSFDPQELELSRGSLKHPPSGMNRIRLRTARNLDTPALRAVKEVFGSFFSSLPIGGLVASLRASGHAGRKQVPYEVRPVP